MDKQWYVVNTYSGHEKKVKEKLEMRAESMDMKDYIFRVVVPEQTEVEVKDGKINVLGTNVINLDIDEVLNFNIIIENTKGKFLTKVFLPICGGFGVLTLIFFIVFGALKEALYLYLAIGALVICAIVYAVYRILLRKTFKK